MTLTLLLLSVAVCLAPWQGPAVGRLDGLRLSDRSAASDDPGPAGTQGPARRPDLPALPGALSTWPRALGTRLRGLTAGRERPDPDALAQVVDLLRAALTAGLPASDALAAVAEAVGHTRPEVAMPLRTAAARLALGATPEAAWRDVPGEAHLAPLASVLVRATDGGGSVNAALDHAAGRMRAEAAAAATARAERASVLVAGPLGLCFLPAFVCLGVLPVVVGLADDMLPGLGL